MDYFVAKIGDQELAIFNTGLRYVFQISDLNKNLLGSLNEEDINILGSRGLLGKYSTGIPGIDELPGIPKSPGFNVMSNNSLSKLFEAAKKSVLDVDKTLKDLLIKLNGM